MAETTAWSSPHATILRTRDGYVVGVWNTIKKEHEPMFADHYKTFSGGAEAFNHVADTLSRYGFDKEAKQVIDHNNTLVKNKIHWYFR